MKSKMVFLTMVIFFLAFVNVATGGEISSPPTGRPTTDPRGLPGETQPAGQQPPQQRQPMRINMGSFHFSLTDSELAGLISQVDKKHHDFSAAANGLKDDFQKHNAQL